MGVGVAVWAAVAGAAAGDGGTKVVTAGSNVMNAAAADALAAQIQARVEQAVKTLTVTSAPPVSVLEFESLAVAGAWKEQWPKTTHTSFETPYTILTVSRMRGDRNQRLITSTTHNWLLGYYAGEMDVMHAEGWVSPPTKKEVDKAPHIYTATGTGKESALYRDGTLVATNSTALSGIGRLSLGGRGEEMSNGDIAEVLVYSRVLTDQEIQAIETYLRRKWFVASPDEEKVFNPATVQGMALWVNADDVQAKDGEKIAIWADASGKGNDLAWADAAVHGSDLAKANIAQQPVLATKALNGRNVVRFTAPNQLVLNIYGETSRSVEAKIWNAPIQAALAKHGAVFLPKRDQPYYIDNPIILKSGQKLVADREAEIRLVPNASTCMVRNENIINGQDAPIPNDAKPDTHILIEGGIWTTLETTILQENGNGRGWLSRKDRTIPSYGVIILSNVRGAVVRNLVVRKSTCYALQLTNIREFLVEGVTFEDQHMDGVHVNGPASDGVIREIRGNTYDCLIGLLPWNWSGYDPSFGQIDHVLVEQIHPNRKSNGIRLLPGTKTFADGRKLDCPVADCVFRDLYGMKGGFAIHDQPPSPTSPATDKCDPIGTLQNVYFLRLVFDERPVPFLIGVNVNGLLIDDVQLNFDTNNFKLVDIGPKQWSPDLDVTVRNFHVTNVTAKAANGLQPVPNPEVSLVQCTDQKATANSGKGRAIIIPHD